jgi:hypothetical protein
MRVGLRCFIVHDMSREQLGVADEERTPGKRFSPDGKDVSADVKERSGWFDEVCFLELQGN